MRKCYPRAVQTLLKIAHESTRSTGKEKEEEKETKGKKKQKKIKPTQKNSVHDNGELGPNSAWWAQRKNV